PAQVVKRVLVHEGPERTTDLAVDEPVRTFQLRDPGGHGEPDAEVPRPPGDLLTEPDLTAGDAADGALTGPAHRSQVRVDAQREVEHVRSRTLRPGLQGEGAGHRPRVRRGMDGGCCKGSVVRLADDE